jgi:hypothetical protein
LVESVARTPLRVFSSDEDYENAATSVAGYLSGGAVRDAASALLKAIGHFAFERGRGVQTALAADCSTAFCAARLVA